MHILCQNLASIHSLNDVYAISMPKSWHDTCNAFYLITQGIPTKSLGITRAGKIANYVGSLYFYIFVIEKLNYFIYLWIFTKWLTIVSINKIKGLAFCVNNFVKNAIDNANQLEKYPIISTIHILGMGVAICSAALLTIRPHRGNKSKLRIFKIRIAKQGNL